MLRKLFGLAPVPGKLGLGSRSPAAGDQTQKQIRGEVALASCLDGLRPIPTGEHNIIARRIGEENGEKTVKFVELRT